MQRKLFDKTKKNEVGTVAAMAKDLAEHDSFSANEATALGPQRVAALQRLGQNCPSDPAPSLSTTRFFSSRRSSRVACKMVSNEALTVAFFKTLSLRMIPDSCAAEKRSLLLSKHKFLDVS